MEIMCNVCNQSFLFKEKDKHSFKWNDHSFSCCAHSIGCDVGELKGDTITEHETNCTFVAKLKNQILVDSFKKIEKKINF